MLLKISIADTLLAQLFESDHAKDENPAMRLQESICAYHRFWRYRLRSERNEISYLFKQRLIGTTVIDIGAHRGAYSFWMHRCVGTDGRVIAFEPQPELVDYLEQLKTSMRLSWLTVVPTALSDAPGELLLVRPRSHWGGASFHLDVETEDHEVFSVPVMTLDEYASMNDLRNVSFIKCDVQDHEFQTLRGGAKLLGTQKPTLLIEQLDQYFCEGSLPDFLIGLGYRGYFFYQRQLVGIEEWPKLRRKISEPFLNYVYENPQREFVTADLPRHDRVAGSRAGAAARRLVELKL